jgi:uncharacterized protein
VILYLDASALVKRYVMEAGSKDVISLTAAAAAVATSLVSRAEVAAALARAVRLGVLDKNGGARAQRRFSREWPDIARIPAGEALVTSRVAGHAGSVLRLQSVSRHSARSRPHP